MRRSTLFPALSSSGSGGSSSNGRGSRGRAGSAYVTTKHDPVGLTQTANTGITCGHLSRLGELLREKQPMLRFTTPEEIGGLAVFSLQRECRNNDWRFRVGGPRMDSAMSENPAEVAAGVVANALARRAVRWCCAQATSPR
jgi:hypothetical protein